MGASLYFFLMFFLFSSLEISQACSYHILCVARKVGFEVFIYFFFSVESCFVGLQEI